jgi:Protein of unknown function (DUF3307)
MLNQILFWVILKHPHLIQKLTLKKFCLRHDERMGIPTNILAITTHNTSLTLAIIGHLVGDYLLQNDWMALKKKSPSFFYKPYWGNRSWQFRLTTCFRWVSIPCLVHCALWTGAVCAFAGWKSPVLIAILFAAHYIQDRTHIIKFWMTRINHQPKFVEPPMAPWSLIVVDNVWHIVTIWLVWRFLL